MGTVPEQIFWEVIDEVLHAERSENTDDDQQHGRGCSDDQRMVGVAVTL